MNSNNNNNNDKLSFKDCRIKLGWSKCILNYLEIEL